MKFVDGSRPALLALLTGAAITAFVTFSLAREHATTVAVASSETQNVTRALEEHARQSLQRIHADIVQANAALVRARATGIDHQPQIVDQLRSLLPQDRLIQSFLVLDQSGNIVLSTQTAKPRADGQTGSLADKDYFTPHVRGADRELVFGAPQPASADKKWLLPISRRINTPDGRFDGVLVAMVEGDIFQRFYDSIERHQSGFVLLFLANGWVAISSFDDQTVVGQDWSASPLFREHIPAWPTGTVREVLLGHGIEHIYSYRALNDYPVVVSYGQSTSAVLAPWRQVAWRDGLLLLIGLMALAGIAFILTQDERRRRESKADTRIAVTAFEAQQSIIVTDADNTILRVNRAFTQITGYSGEEVVGKKPALLGAGRESQRFYDEMWQTLNSTGAWYGDLWNRRKNGEEYPARLSVTAVMDINGRLTHYVATMVDITKERAATMQLRASEARFRSLTALSSDWYWEQDWNFRYIHFSDSAAQWGSMLASHYGKTRWELSFAGVSEQQWAEHRALLEAHQPFREFEYQRVSDQGDTIWLSASGEPLFDEQGCFTGYRGVGRNVTERKLAEAALSESALRHSAILSAAMDAIVTMDSDGLVIEFNSVAQSMFGYGESEVLGRPLADVIIPLAHREAHRRGLARFQAGGVPTVAGRLVEISALRRDGTEFPVELWIQRIGEVQPAQFTGFIRDITERKRTEEELQLQSERLKIAQNAARMIVLDWHIAQDRLEFSASSEWLRGPAPPDGAKYPVFADQVHSGDREIFLAGRDRAVQTLQGRVLEYRFVRTDGQVLWLHAHESVIANAHGKAEHLIVALSDITERKRSAQALQASLREKEALLMEVHHRVKNNLQVITSLLRLEAGRSTVPEAVDVLKAMQGRIRSMAQLHELLYRSGTFASVDLGVYLGQVVTQGFNSQVHSANLLQLKLHMGSVQVGMDQAIACGLLVNELVSNCLKHGFPDDRSGQVYVELQPADPATVQTDALWRLRVRDTGVGLPPDFEDRREQSLGMTLVGDLSQQAGGTLEFQSQPGVGAEFSVVFRALEPVALVMPL